MLCCISVLQVRQQPWNSYRDGLCETAWGQYIVLKITVHNRENYILYCVVMLSFRKLPSLVQDFLPPSFFRCALFFSLYQIKEKEQNPA